MFEDAHWIDPTSLDLLERMVSCATRLPLLLLVTCRPEFQPGWLGQPHVTTLSLSRLGPSDSAGIIRGITRDRALPDVVVEQILSRTDGVPLFIEELTRTLLESGLLRETAGPLRPRWTIAATRHPDDAASLAGGPPRPAWLGQGCGHDRRRDRT